MERALSSRLEDSYNLKENQVENNNATETGTSTGSAVTTCLVIALVFFLDQLTKLWAMRDLLPLHSKEIIPGFFSLTFVQNKGAAFGMFGELPSPWREASLGVISVIALIFVLNMLRNEARTSRLGQLSIALILGGAFGNILDRLRLGAVVDFLDFYVGEYHWPAFNVADSSICLGVMLLFLWMTQSHARNGAGAK